ncbi:MAG: lysylphosphatidylglycerol synthase domain-containing protein [Thiohalomonadaceae bacterium]
MSWATDRWRDPWVWLLPLVAGLLLAVLWGTDLNRAVFLAINSIGLYTAASLWSNITVLGDSLVVFTLALVFVGRYPRLVWALVIAALLATFVVHGFKEWLNLYRPPAVFGAGEINVIGTAHKAVSFPSGHTTAAFTLVALLCLQADIGRGIKLALIAWASLVGISRIVVGVHWPTDVLGGAAIGWGCAAVGMWLAPRVGWGLTPRAQRMFAVILVLAALSLVFFHDSGYPQARALEVLIALGSLAVAVPGLRKVFRQAAEEAREHAAARAVDDDDVPEKRPRLAALLVRLAVTVLIFALIFRSIDFAGVQAVLADLVPRLLGLAIIFQLLSTALASYRWRLLMRPLGFPMGFEFYLKSYFKGSFFNQGLPTSIGGDAVRMLDVAGQGFRKREAFYGVFIDRVLGLVGLLVLNLVASALAPDLLPAGVSATINTLVGLGIAGFLGLLLLRRVAWLQRWQVLRPFYTISQRLALVLGRPREALAQAGLSVAVHVLSLIAVFLIGRSVGLEYDLTTFMVVVPPVILLTLIPVSLAGWGVREGAMIGLFTLIGASKAGVLSMSLLYGLVLVLTSLPGFYVYLTNNTGREKATGKA